MTCQSRGTDTSQTSKTSCLLAGIYIQLALSQTAVIFCNTVDVDMCKINKVYPGSG